jgi:hypothetical protein
MLVRPTLRQRLSRAAPWLGLALLTLLQLVLFAAHLPGIRRLPGWFYPPIVRGLGAGWAMAAVCLLTPWLVHLTLRAARAGRTAGTLTAALTLGLVTQALFVPLDANREDSLLARHEGGHGEFHAIAQGTRGHLRDVLQHYDERAEARELGVFAPTKPPGALAVYAGLDALGRGPLAGRFTGLRTLAQLSPRVSGYPDGFVASVLLFPLFTALLLPLVVLLGARLHQRDQYLHEAPPEGRPGALEAGAAAAVLTATSPALLLITYHLDGALYPLCAVLALWLVSVAMSMHGPQRGLSLSARVLALATLAGVVFGAGLYVSYSLLPALGLVLGVVMAFGLATRHAARPLRRSALTLLGFALGAMGVTAAFVILLDYQPAHRFEAAMRYHERWKAAVPVGPWRVWALLEWALYAGFPLVGLLLARALRSLRHLREARQVTSTLLPLGVVALLLAVSALSGTNEVARMWLFLLPVAAIAAVPASARGRSVEALAAAQLLLALVMKANQPW